MPYRTIYCTICESRLQFFRHEKRNYVACPACGLGMDLAPNQMKPPTEKPATKFRMSLPRTPPPKPRPGTVQVLPSQTGRETARRMLIATAIFSGLVLMMYSLRLI